MNSSQTGIKAITKHTKPLLSLKCIADRQSAEFFYKPTDSYASRQRRTNWATKAFSAAGPTDWNYLPTDLRQPAILDSHWRHFYLVRGTKAQCASPFNCGLEILLLTYPRVWFEHSV